MASAVTNWGSGQFLGISFGLYTPPIEFWCALCTGEPGLDADGTSIQDLEPDSTTAGYQRVSIPLGTANWDDPDDSLMTSTLTDITFPPALADWGVITHFALCSDQTFGDVYLYGEFDVGIDIPSNVQFAIPAGAVIISFMPNDPAVVAL